MDPVKRPNHYSIMKEELSAGRRLKLLRERSGWKVRPFAEALGMPSSTYSSKEDKYKDRYFDIPFAVKLMPMLVGRGAPPISREEVLELAGVDFILETLSSQFKSDEISLDLWSAAWEASMETVRNASSLSDIDWMKIVPEMVRNTYNRLARERAGRLGLTHANKDSN